MVYAPRMANQGILILTTGGTIDKNYFDALSEYQIVDSGIPALLDEARVRAEEVIRSKKDKMDALVKVLLEKETVEQDEFKRVMGDAAAKV